MLDAEKLKEGLQHFCGSETSYKHTFGICYTEGVRYLAKNGECYWLIDAIASYSYQLKGLGFQLWLLNVGDSHEFIKPAPGNGAVLTCWKDTPSPKSKPVVVQQIPFTDFPLPEIKLYLQHKVLLCQAKTKP